MLTEKFGVELRTPERRLTKPSFVLAWHKAAVHQSARCSFCFPRPVVFLCNLYRPPSLVLLSDIEEKTCTAGAKKKALELEMRACRFPCFSVLPFDLLLTDAVIQLHSSLRCIVSGRFHFRRAETSPLALADPNATPTRYADAHTALHAQHRARSS